MIISPIPYVKVQKVSWCTSCEKDVRTTWEHAFYPGMKCCDFCLETVGQMDSDIVGNLPAMKLDHESWDRIAKVQGRQVHVYG